MRDLYEELKMCEWFVKKMKDDRYAQNVYCALCNMRWQPKEPWAILKNEFWSVSWRGAGGIVSDIRNQSPFSDGARAETYMDWYCSGMLRVEEDSESNVSQYVGEGVVTDEIREDLAKLGWQPVPYED